MTETEQPQTDEERQNGTDPEAETADIFKVPVVTLAFAAAPDLADLADALIEEYDDAFHHLRDYSIDYLWKRNGGKSKRQNKRGAVQITGALLRHYSKKTFVVWLAADHAESEKWTTRQAEAIMFHLLLQMGEDPKRGGPMMIAPDFTGFRRELEAYGAWSDSLRALESTMKQLGLGLDAKVAVEA